MQKDFIYENYLKMPDDLEFEQAMKVYEELLEENLEEDEIYDFTFIWNRGSVFSDIYLKVYEELRRYQ